ncbi:L-type lectin-domain containing receptor kinase S.4-like [Mercurialis annua]|uniref:L-type lectin-domain containing receptor kinase S.4-like n=1 Tax=Mercurialis annua TaxID=3986 RepID=UPI00215E02CE|nr:L-type lectin-domain containing receptor kinase S.4-like [Mercurialis annua]
MAKSLPISQFPFKFLIFNLLILNPIFGQSLETLTLITNNPKFDSEIALTGNATISADGSTVQLTTPNTLTSGFLFYNDSFKFHSSNPSKTASFSTEFEFSVTGNYIGLSLLMGPYNSVPIFMGQHYSHVLYRKKYLAIEFGYSMGDDDDADKISVIIRVNNELLGHTLTKRGQTMKSWIDYDANSKRLEIRITELSDKRPYDPFVASALDLSKILGDNEVYVALGSTNSGNQLAMCDVYSWRFRLRKVSDWMHSLPVDPHGSIVNGSGNGDKSLREHRKMFCPLAILASCVALLAFLVLFMRSMFVDRKLKFPIDRKVQPVDFRYEKIGVVVENDEKLVTN